MAIMVTTKRREKSPSGTRTSGMRSSSSSSRGTSSSGRNGSKVMVTTKVRKIK